jgi:3-dehydroquinate dehydratase-2
MKILIINGPNLNMLGLREENLYGKDTLKEIINYTNNRFIDTAIELEWTQSNIEGEIINSIQSVIDKNYSGIIINPGGYTHTSIAIYDALKIVNPKLIIIEAHLTNISAREDFRNHTLTGKAATAIISGLGKETYYVAVQSIIELTKE